MRLGLDKQTANDIYDILVSICGANERMREDFVFHQTDRWCDEYRFQGHLGFGGKFWRNQGFRPDDSWGEWWYVNCYPEDATKARDNKIELANALLWKLQQD